MRSCGVRLLALTIFDTGHRWVVEAKKAADKRKLFGGPKARIEVFPCAVREGHVFFPIRQFEPGIRQNRHWLEQILRYTDREFKFIQDLKQLQVYEDKIAQYREWAAWMPATWHFKSKEKAVRFLDSFSHSLPFVSKSSIGSASHNVRLLNTKKEAMAELDAAFSDWGFIIQGGRQKGYVLWQQFYPSDVTYRVAILGTRISAYKRFNGKGSPFAGAACEVGLEPIKAVDELPAGLLNFAYDFFEHARTKFCAIDVIRGDDDWRLLETACSWARSYQPQTIPWIGTPYTLQTQFELLMDEIRDGAWG